MDTFSHVAGGDETGAEGKFRFGRDIVYDLQHGTTFVKTTSIRIIEHDVDRVGVNRVAGTGEVAVHDIIACRITGKRIVTVGDHTYPNAVAIEAEELAGGIGLHGAVTLRKDETGTVDRRVLRSGEVDQRRDRIQFAQIGYRIKTRDDQRGITVVDQVGHAIIRRLQQG